MAALSNIEKSLRPVTRASAILATLAGLGIAYVFIVNNIYRPVVTIVSINYDEGTATVKIGNREKQVFAGSTVAVGWGGDWGVRFGSADGDKYDRLELVKNDLTYKTLSTK